jgi:hypothetical protein
MLATAPVWTFAGKDLHTRILFAADHAQPAPQQQHAVVALRCALIGAAIFAWHAHIDQWNLLHQRSVLSQ